MRSKPAPTQKETEFQVHELFFSTTDLKGVITFGNDVFERLSGYAMNELVGSPHSIIRHPDMPQAAFQLVWDYLQQGKRVAGYVKNLAADGSFYWVVAMITPIDGGYLSIRLKPTSGLLATVSQLYAKMRAMENEIKQKGGTSKEAMAGSRKILDEALASLGFADYDAFMQELLLREVNARKKALGAGARSSSMSFGTAVTAACCLQVQREVARMFEKLEPILSLEESLRKEMAFIRTLGAELHLISLNAQVRTAGLQREGRTLQTVAHQMSQSACVISRSTEEVCGTITSVTGQLKAAAAEIATSHLSVEMMSNFARESSQADQALMQKRIGELVQVVRQTFEHADRAIHEVVRKMQKLEHVLVAFIREIRTLEILHVTGKVEAVRSAENQTISMVFDEVTVKAREARTKLSQLTTMAQAAAITPPDRSAIEQNLARLVAA
jgi:aerotaxis receptor